MACLKWLKRLIIPVFAILLMSHNTFAASTVIDLNNYEVAFTHTGTVNCYYGDTSLNANLTNVYSCPLAHSNTLNRIETNQTFNFTEGDILEFDIMAYSTVDLKTVYFLRNQKLDPQWGFDLLDVKLIDNNAYGSFYDTASVIPSGYNVNQIWHFTLKANMDSTGRTIGYGQTNQIFLNYNNQGLTGNTLLVTLRNIVNYHFVGSSENAEQQQATQDAADEASSSGSSSEASAEAATSSLISVIGGFVNVLTSAQPTNCKINANLNHIDMGQLDLCANPVPSYIQIIGSIILICAAIPLAIVLFNRFIGLFRSFQG